MKELFRAVRDLVHLTGVARLTHDNPTGQFLKTLPKPLQNAMIAFEARNRGHQHQISDEALSPGDMLTHPFPGTPEHSRRGTVCDTSRELLESYLACPDLPASRLWLQLLSARDELGWLAYHAELLVAGLCRSRRAGLPAPFAIEESHVCRQDRKCLLTLKVKCRRSKLMVSRTFPLFWSACTTLRETDLFVQRNFDLVRDILEGVSEWDEFKQAAAAAAAEKAAEVAPLLVRARAELQRALSTFSEAERTQLIQNWTALRPSRTES